MKKIKTLTIIISLTATIAVTSVAYAASDTFDISMTVDNYLEINVGGCASGIQLVLNADSDMGSCEFTVRANEPWDLAFREYNGGSGLSGTYEADMLRDAGLTTHPDIIADCVEVSNICDLSDALSSHSEWGVWFTDGATGTQTLTPTACNAQNSACAVESGNTQLFDEQAQTTSAVEGINLYVFASVDAEVHASPNYTDGIELTIWID